MALIELQHVWKIYDTGDVQVEALRDANLTIDSGEFVALTGQSGSGKSTLMNLLGCLDRPTRGSYRLAGEEVAELSRNERARIRNQRIGFVFQNYNLLARTTARETSNCRCCTLNASRPANAGSGRPRRWSAWGWPTGRTTIPASFPAGSSSALPSPAPWLITPRFSWETNRRETSIRRRATMSCTCSRRSTANRGSP